MISVRGVNARRILALLQAKPDRPYTACSGIERGRQGGKFRPYGRQDHAGAMALVTAGVAVVVSSRRSQFYHNGYASHGHELTIRLKEPSCPA
jgi:hypothetical protein